MRRVQSPALYLALRAFRDVEIAIVHSTPAAVQATAGLVADSELALTVIEQT